MKWIALLTVVVGLFLGATAIDKNDEQSCKDRIAENRRSSPLGGSVFDSGASCDGFLPW